MRTRSLLSLERQLCQAFLDANGLKSTSTSIDKTTVHSSRILEAAARVGNLDVFHVFFSNNAGCDLCVCLEEVLLFAAEKGHLNIVKFLESKRDAGKVDWTEVARYAFQSGQSKVAKHLLLSKEAEVDLRVCLEGTAMESRMHLMKFLIRNRGVMPDKDILRASVSCMHDHGYDAVWYLLRNFDLPVKDAVESMILNFSYKPLGGGRRVYPTDSDMKVFRALLSHSISGQDNSQFLIDASYHGVESFVAALISDNREIGIRASPNQNNSQALLYAINQGHDSVADILLSDKREDRVSF